MRCVICGGRRGIWVFNHKCPKAVLDRIDREDRKADLEAEIQEDDLNEYRFRFLDSDGTER